MVHAATQDAKIQSAAVLYALARLALRKMTRAGTITRKTAMIATCAEIAFLDGQQTPTIQSSEADFNTLGIQHRGFFDLVRWVITRERVDRPQKETRKSTKSWPH